jgi:hypothetical protein
MVVSGQVHVQAALPSKQAPPVLVEFESGWAAERCGQSGEQNSFLFSEIKPAPLDRQACSLVSISSTLTQLNCFAFIKSKEKRFEGVNVRLEV